jgi:ClpP class serine protease
LVDEIGGLYEAVEEARRRAEIPEKKKIRLVRYYRRRRLWELLLPEFDPGFTAAAGMLPAFDGLDFLAWLARHTILLWMPFDIRIR